MKIYSWGSNSHGQLSQNTEAEQILLPKPINFTEKPKLITGGGKHTVLLTSDGKLFFCGDNDKGQLGIEPTVKLINTFQYLNFHLKVVKVSCGWDFNLILTENSSVFAWGSNLFGQLGLSVEKVKYLSAPQKVFDNKIIDIGTGLRHSVVVTSGGLVFTSGYNRKGQLGVGDNVSFVDKFTLVKTLNNCRGISCGECHCIAKTINGEFYSWGSNKFGQLGVDPAIISFTATPVQIVVFAETTRTNHLFSGWAHNFILTEKGEVVTWGRNDFGQLGEQRPFNWKPEVIKSLKNIKQVSLGSHHSVVLTENGEVFTWGWNEHGNCGNGSSSNVLQPQKLKQIFGVKLIGSGAAHSFLWFSKMSSNPQAKVLEIENANVQPALHQERFTSIPVIEENLDYSSFFELFLLPNRPCVINNAAKNWPCVSKWINNKSLNVKYFRNNFKNVNVPISDCGKKEFNVQKKSSMKLFDYLDYWEQYKKHSYGMDCLYLKDWHFVKEFPNEEAYRVPSYFASDWLNEYYDSNSQLKDDYRFVYIGPKGSWTPFHADVFTSYSWSVNICGRKKWILFPPGAENNFRDNLGNLTYSIDTSNLNAKGSKKGFQSFEVIQEEGQGLFVPSGWYHQVWNLEDTISINHNWINGCNIHCIWASVKNSLSAVMKEISDCKDMKNWMSQCQLVLSATFGFNYQFFHSLLLEIAKSRIEALKANKNLNVYGDWSFGQNHMKFDLRRVLTILNSLKKDDNFLEISKIENSLNHSLEFLDSLTVFLNSEEFS